MKGVTAVLSSAETVLPRALLPRRGTRAESTPTSEHEPPPTPPPADLEPSVYRFVLKYSLRSQIVLLVLTLVSFPFLYYSLKLPKTIVNRAISGHHFPEDVFGIPFQQVPYLMLLCGVFLALVFINGGFKYFINT